MALNAHPFGQDDYIQTEFVIDEDECDSDEEELQSGIFKGNQLDFRQIFIKEWSILQEKVASGIQQYKHDRRLKNQQNESKFVVNSESHQKLNYYQATDLIEEIFRIYMEQKIIRKASERYYPQEILQKYMNQDQLYYQQNILEYLNIPQDLQAFMSNWFYNDKQKENILQKISKIQKPSQEHSNDEQMRVVMFETDKRDEFRAKIQEIFNQIMPFQNGKAKYLSKLQTIGSELADIVHKYKADEIINGKELGGFKKVPFVGIAGIPGSGKSYFSKGLKSYLKGEFGVNALIIGMDGYHYYRKQLDQMEDPVHAHARRGAEFTFDSQRFVDDIRLASIYGHGSFPDFDHAKKDPEEEKLKFDCKKTDIVIIEGLYVLLEKEPWNQLKEHVFEKTYFIDVPKQITAKRLKKRMVKKMGLSQAEAEERINNNDLVNADFILKNVDMNKHELVNNHKEKLSKILKNVKQVNVIQEFEDVFRKVCENENFGIELQYDTFISRIQSTLEDISYEHQIQMERLRNSSNDSLRD